MSNNYELITFLTNELIEFESETFSVPKMIPRSDYNFFYSSFSQLKHLLTKYDIIMLLQNIIMDNCERLKKDFNIYPFLYDGIQKCSLRNTSAEIKKNYSEVVPQATNIAHLFKKTLNSTSTKRVNSIFGTYFIVENIDICFLSTAKLISGIILPPSMDSYSLPSLSDPNTNISIQSLLSLTGKSKFLGLYYPFVDCFDFRIDILMAVVQGSGISAATSIFYDVITKHLEFLMESVNAIILDFQIPNVTITYTGKTQTKTVTVSDVSLWTFQDWIRDDGKSKEIVTTLAEVLVNSGLSFPSHLSCIKVQALIPIYSRDSLHLSNDGYHKIQIGYVPHTLQIKDKSDSGEVWSCFGNRENEFTQHLFSCVFFDQAHAEAFMTIILHQSLKETISSNPIENGSKSLALKRRLLPISSTSDVKGVKEVKGIFGIFSFPDSEENVPSENVLDSQIKNDFDVWKEKLVIVEKSWMEVIVKSDKMLDFFLILENIVNLIVAKNSFLSNNIDGILLEMEVKQVLNSPIYKLHHIIQMNIILRQLLYCFNEHRKIELVLHLFHKFINEIKIQFNKISSQDSSSFITGVSHKIMNRLEEIIFRVHPDTHLKEILNSKMILELKFINNVCYSLMWHFIGDYFLKCPNIEKLIASLEKQFPNTVHKTEIQVVEEDLRSTEDYINFSKRTVTMKADSDPINVITYLQSINFNLCWREFLVKMLPGKDDDHFIDPYSLLANLFSIYSMKYNFDIFPNILVEKSLFQFDSKDSIICKVVDCEAYGLKSAVMLFDVMTFKKLENILSAFKNKDFENKIGLFEVMISDGMMGEVIYHGKVYPWIHRIDLVENIFIKGPDSCLEEGSQIFAKTVLNHVVKINKDMVMENSMMIGLFLTDINQRWTLDDISKNGKEIMIQVARCVRNNGSVYIKTLVYFQWRYISVILHLQFHFFNFQRTQYFKSISNENGIIHPYQLLFFSREDAQVYFTYGGYLKIIDDPFSTTNLAIANKSLERSIEKCYNSQNWLSLYRDILTKGAIEENYGFINEASKILQGTLGQLDYLNFLNKTIQNIIYNVMEVNKFSTRNPITISAVSKKSDKKVVKKISISDILQISFNGYYLLLMKVFENETLDHFHLKDVLISLLNDVTMKDVQKKMCIPSSNETIMKLEQIREIIETVECFYGYSSQWYCPNSRIHIQNLRSKLKTKSVENDYKYQENITIKMIQSEKYKQWCLNPKYE